MSSENISIVDENNYVNISESQTLDSLLQSSCDTPSQAELNETTVISESKPESVPDSFRKRSHSESMNAYINSLKPKDVIIFIEDIKYFSHGTVFMNDFRTCYIDPILKYLNGGDPLKNDFGRDPHTSAYSLFSFSPFNTSVNDTCRDTVRIIQIMDALDSLKSSERNLNKTYISMKTILEKAKNEFLYYDEYRNNHPKRKRYLIYIFHSDICLDDIDDIVKDLNSIKVRFSAFGVYKHEACVKLCEALNYNKKGCKDLSCFGRSDRWPITMSNGLYKYFESRNSSQSKNKSLKWPSSREQTDSNEFEFMNFMNSNAPQMSDNVMQLMTNSMSDNQLNANLNVRSISSSDINESNYQQISGNLIGQNQNAISHANMQSKYASTSTSNYYPNVSNQSDISKTNQMPFFPSPDQFYPTSSSVNNTSHRSTPSSLMTSQSPQFHVLNSHASMPQTPLHNDQIKPNNAENSGEIMSPMSNLPNQFNMTKSNQINPEMEMNSLHRFPNNNMPFNSNTIMTSTNFNQTRFMPRQQYFPINPINQGRNNFNLLFEGKMKYNEDLSTDIRIQIEQPVDQNLLNMHLWEKQCSLHYISYVEAHQLIIYGKSNSDIDNGSTDGSVKTPIEVQIKMSQQIMETITGTLSSKPNQIIAVIKPMRHISHEVHVQCICVLLNRNPPGIKFLIPADPRGLLNELRNRIQSATYPVGAANPMYNQMKRNNYVNNNQPMYGMPSNIPMQRPMLNRYSHNGGNIPMLSVNGNPNYRPMSHPSGFMNNQQMSPAPNYILHQGQYPSNANQQSSGAYQLPMEMNMQPNQTIYEQNSYL